MVKKRFIDPKKAVRFQLVHREDHGAGAPSGDDASPFVLRTVAKGRQVENEELISLAQNFSGEAHAQAAQESMQLSRQLDFQKDTDKLMHTASLLPDLDHVGAYDDFQDYDESTPQLSVDEADDDSSGSDHVPNPRQAVEKLDPEDDPTLYGIDFPNIHEYDYMQHLKPIGQDTNAVYVPAVQTVDKKANPAAFKLKEMADAVAEIENGTDENVPWTGGIHFKDAEARKVMNKNPETRLQRQARLKEEAYQQHKEHLERNLNNVKDAETVRPEAYEAAIGDVEPSMQEIFYALEDEAYVEDGIDDFFEALDAEEVPKDVLKRVEPDAYTQHQAERKQEDNKLWEAVMASKLLSSGNDHDQIGFDLDDNGCLIEGTQYGGARSVRSVAMTAQTARTARTARMARKNGLNDDTRSVASWRSRMTSGTRRITPREASLFSMSSSVMPRTEQLTMIDDRFERVLEDYDDEALGELDEDETFNPQGRGCTADTADDDLMRALGQWNQEFRVIHAGTGRARVGEHKNPLEALDAWRAGLRETVKLTEEETMVEVFDPEAPAHEDDKRIPMPVTKEYNLWDVQTAHSGTSNIYNRPAILRARPARKPRHIILRKDGMPVVCEEEATASRAGIAPSSAGSEQDEDSDDHLDSASVMAHRDTSFARNRKETKEERAARKAALKEEKRERRAVKKDNKVAFKEESQRQVRIRHKQQAIQPAVVTFN
ncbi:hypothetical protein CXG81DRAFT_20262 [Caulochytrium protostelioides]|nr:hypothetical protein CXG81DRAFT_20262 [Caulochytrium protostelioides]|eukprot:RKO99687.1 hypothetical protein CXG81DRAFT_20262 [Caulochytrium protostelioides]